LIRDELCNQDQPGTGEVEMAKSRATTLQQRFGFCDTDLKVPKHDEIMVWLDRYSEFIIRDIMTAAVILKPNMRIVEDDVSRGLNRSCFSKAKESYMGIGDPPEGEIIGTENIWESPVMGQNGFMVGFIDMESNVKYWKPGVNWDEGGYGREPVLPYWELYRKNLSMFFEVKTSIPSIGELIRQIRMYQEYADGIFVVVSPDDKGMPIITSQGIWFVKYPSGEVCAPKGMDRRG
jgi:hypothetical protein